MEKQSEIACIKGNSLKGYKHKIHIQGPVGHNPLLYCIKIICSFIKDIQTT